MKPALERWMAAGIVAVLAGPAMGQPNQWICGVNLGPGSLCEFVNEPKNFEWNNVNNWSLGVVPGTNQDVRVWQTIPGSPTLIAGSTTINYTEASPVVPGAVFNSLWIDGELTFNHGGTDTLRTMGLTMGNGAVYSFSSSSATGVTVYGSAIVGDSGGSEIAPTTFAHTGQGIVTVVADLVLGQSALSLANFTMNSGPGSAGALNVTGKTVVGQAGEGTFTQSSGTHTTANLVLGQDSLSTGTYSQSGTLTVTGKTVVGQSGKGTFDQNGATHTTGTLVLGEVWRPESEGAVGTYNLKGGTLTVTSGQIVGDAGTGVFNNKPTAPATATHIVIGDLVLGNQGSGNGAYELSGGGSVTSANTTVGAEGVGVFIHGDGTHTTGTLLIGSQSGGQGSYTIGGAGSTLNVSGELGIGVGVRGAGGVPQLLQAAGAGSFTQSGGQVAVSGGFWQDSNTSLQSVYRLEGGTLTLGRDKVTNWTASMSGNSLFEHKGGALTYSAASEFSIGTQYSASYDTTYRMTGAGTEASFFTLVVGNLGKGIFDQQAGTVNASLLVIGQGPRAFAPDQARTQGVYNLSAGGALNVEHDMIVGWGFSPSPVPPSGPGGKGTFTQTGGDVRVGIAGFPPQDLRLGVAGTVGGGMGTYDMRAGTLTVAGAIRVGDTGNAAPGTGEFLQKGGSVKAGSLIVSSGRYDLSAGSLGVSGKVAVGGGGASSALSVSGTGALSAARLDINDNGTLDYSGGTIRLDGGGGTLAIAAGGKVDVRGGESLTLDGNVNNAGLFKVTGTTIRYTGEFNNTGAYISDPSYNIFDADLVVTGIGYLVGGLGDVFQVGGNFRNSSSNAAQWDTDLASLIFFGAGTHEFGVAGDSPDAFEWGDIRAGDDVFLRFFDGSAIAGMVLRVGVLDLAEQLAGIILDGQSLTIYFDQARQENAYLLAALNSGQLPTGLRLIGYGEPPNNAPEPSTLVLMAAGLWVLRRQTLARRQMQ